MAQNRNEYLDQVVAQQAQLESDLRSKRSAPRAAPPPPGAPASAVVKRDRAAGPAPDNLGSPAVDVRITGFGRWKTVIVPPNAFVVHTRRGRSEPLHIGLGVSFRYRPATDSFLVVPGAMQTILISAYCICRELQGVVVQAYVQWIVQDFATAYRKLDFGDAVDPMRLVNLQLKEQAEAAIKDKVATMSVHEVLSDKQPIIEELTSRLRGVAEGEGASDTGLGLRIVTVQIKEAIVSSARLWENLQQPFRSEQGRIARLAQLSTEEAISEREMAAARVRETQRLESDRELSDLRARNEALAFDREAAEGLRRAEREQEDQRRLADLSTETTLHELALERRRSDEETEIARMRVAAEQELARLKVDGELAVAQRRTAADHESRMLGLERQRVHGEIANAQSPERIQAQLVAALPEIASKLPKPTELRAVTVNGANTTTLAGLLTELGAIVGAIRAKAG